MRRFIRRTIGVMGVLGVLMIVVVWGVSRSNEHHFSVRLDPLPCVVGIVTNDRKVYLMISAISRYTLPQRLYLDSSPRRNGFAPLLDHGLDWAVPGFGFGSARSHGFQFILRISHWLSLSAFAGMIVIRVWRRPRRRPKPGHCYTCGYDLRGNPTATACPECGGDIPGDPIGGR